MQILPGLIARLLPSASTWVMIVELLRRKLSLYIGTKCWKCWDCFVYWYKVLNVSLYCLSICLLVNN